MRRLGIAAGIITVVLSAPVLGAQQSPARPGQRPRTEITKGSPQAMMMDSLNTRLDSLVDQMNRARGNQKVPAMAAVINELVAQRKAMQSRMHQMMEGDGGMMRMKNDSGPSAAPRPVPRKDSVSSDTAGHEGHHPPQ